MMSVVPTSRRQTGAFTMVELALCIAIIAVAMVAIIGVLPAGLGVQKQNREDTIIAQEASHWMELLRSGSGQFDDVTNYVDFISVVRQQVKATSPATNIFIGRWFNGPSTKSFGSHLLYDPTVVFGLLSLPKYDTTPNDFAAAPITITNSVSGVFRAFSGSFNEKIFPQSYTETPPDSQTGFAFRYLMRVELTPVPSLPKDQTDAGLRQWSAMQRGLYDLRLTFEWPVVGNDVVVRTGGNLRTFRAQIAAQPRYQRDAKGNIVTAPDSSINLRLLTPAASRLPVL